jgi:molybdate transport system substrate-binding protein
VSARRLLRAALLLALPALAHAQVFPGPKIKDAAPGDLRVIATAALIGPLDSIQAAADKAVGRHVVIEYGSARGNLKELALSGQPFEVAILLPDVNDALAAAGKVRPARYPLASIDVAIGLRGDAPAPDVSTPAALKAAMLGARSVKYSPTGAALLTVRKILGDLAIADQVRDSSQLREPVPLAPGEYEINLFPISEIVTNSKLRNLGPVIPAFQVPSVIEATVGSAANDPEAALKLIRFLQGPAIRPGLKAARIDQHVTGH